MSYTEVTGNSSRHFLTEQTHVLVWWNSNTVQRITQPTEQFTEIHRYKSMRTIKALRMAQHLKPQLAELLAKCLEVLDAEDSDDAVADFVDALVSDLYGEISEDVDMDQGEDMDVEEAEEPCTKHTSTHGRHTSN